MFRERLILGHIRAHRYLGLFGVVEEMILPLVIAHASSLGEVYAAAALHGFASEEAQHLAPFRRFSKVFARGFEHEVELVGPADAVARAVLGHSEPGVSLAILHIEWNDPAAPALVRAVTAPSSPGLQAWCFATTGWRRRNTRASTRSRARFLEVARGGSGVRVFGFGAAGPPRGPSR